MIIIIILDYELQGFSQGAKVGGPPFLVSILLMCCRNAISPLMWSCFQDCHPPFSELWLKPWIRMNVFNHSLIHLDVSSRPHKDWSSWWVCQWEWWIIMLSFYNDGPKSQWLWFSWYIYGGKHERMDCCRIFS